MLAISIVSSGGPMGQEAELRMFDSIANYFSRHNSVRKVAENPATAAELLLLIHLGFADGEHTPSETAAFSKIAEEQFGISRDALPDVIKYLYDYGYETTTGQAAALFGELAPDRRIALIENLMTIAAADNHVDADEVALIHRIAAILGVPPQEVERLYKGASQHA
ncbi:TerB family tellurite resistance protein [uncultured Bartonella sp.]|uniref:tellurite resistance TerB family protein n=2 Tax=uncultured Bartonella sp. TaxID=104108 RepID=UPI0026327D55|nr:TerB family tellurite resistance protein [uncultured Bartonella sp.]